MAASVASRYALGADGVGAARPGARGSRVTASRYALGAEGGGAARPGAYMCSPRKLRTLSPGGEWGCRRRRALRAAREARCKACFELLPRARVGWHTARTSVPPPPPRSSGAPVRWLMARGRRASGVAAAPRSHAAGAPAARRRRAVGGACACRARSNGRRRPLVVVVRTHTPNSGVLRPRLTCALRYQLRFDCRGSVFIPPPAMLDFFSSQAWELCRDPGEKSLARWRSPLA